MLVMQGTYEISQVFVYQMSEVEKKRRKLIKKLEKKGVTWQAPAKKEWLARLLVNERVVILLLKYLKVIKVKIRKGAREKKQEWKKKNNYAGEKLLG